jgi:hypothetical protein
MVEIENRSVGSLALKVRAYQAHSLANLRCYFLLRADKVQESAQGCWGDETLHQYPRWINRRFVFRKQDKTP